MRKKFVKKMSNKSTMTDKQKSVHELIKNNNFLHQYCDFINSENQKNSMKLTELATYMALMERTFRENSRMFELLMAQMNPKTMEKIKKELDNTVKSNQSPQKDILAKNLMHDDITVRCPNCKSISTINEKNCKECGYKIIEK